MQKIDLFKSYTISNRLTLKNRFVMAPMTTWSGNDDGTLSDAEIDYYSARSGGVGMLITATTYMQAHGKGFNGQFYAGDDSMLPSLKRLANVIKKGGAKAILQVFHAGRKADPNAMPDGITRSASAIAAKREDNNTPQAMTQFEIEQTIHAFKAVVISAHHAGFDGIEIHGANTYLLQQFFSPHANRRTDQWGGDVNKRMQLPLAIVKACLAARDTLANKAFIVGYRFSPEENSEPGIALADTKKLINALCKTEIDYLHVSLSDYQQTSMRDNHATQSVLEQVIDYVDTRKPLIAVGSVYDLVDAENIVNSGANLVAIGRQLLIDNKTIEKWQAGQTANALYNIHGQTDLHIPKALHDVIISRPGWVPF